MRPSGTQANSSNPAYRPTKVANDIDFERAAAVPARARVLVVMSGLLAQADFFRADLPHETRRPNDKGGDENDEPDCLFERRIDVVAGKAFDQAYDQAAKIGARHAAEATEHYDRKSREDEITADIGRQRVDRRQQCAGNARQGATETKRQQISPFDIDAHQPRRLTVLDDCANGFARHRTLQEQHESESDTAYNYEDHEAHAADLESEHIDQNARIAAAEAARFPAGQCEHRVLEQDQKPEGRENLHHRFVLQRLQNRSLNGEAEDEHQRCNHEQRQVRVDPEIGGTEIGRIHCQHHKFALREIDDAHDTENKIQSDADETVNAAEQDAGNQDVEKRFHRRLAEKAEPTCGCTLARLLPSFWYYLRGTFTSFTSGCAASFG